MGFKVHAAFLLLTVAFLGAAAYENLEQGNCPDEFLSFAGGRCLRVNTKRIGWFYRPDTWATAREKCRAMSTSSWTVDLAFSLDEDVMQQFSSYIVNEVPSLKAYTFLVGAEKDTPSGQWEWVDGQRVDPFSYVWNINYPLGARDTDVKTMLVPTGAYNRFYMLGISASGVSPSYICEAAPKCA